MKRRATLLTMTLEELCILSKAKQRLWQHHLFAACLTGELTEVSRYSKAQGRCRTKLLFFLCTRGTVFSDNRKDAVDAFFKKPGQGGIS